MTWRPVSIINAAVVTIDERHGQASPWKRSRTTLLTHLRKRNAWLRALPMVERMEPQRKTTTLCALTTLPRLFTCTTKFPEKLRKCSLRRYRNE